MDGEEGFQDGHQEPGTCSSQREEVTPSGIDFVGEVCKPSHAEELKSGIPLLLPVTVFVSKRFGWNLSRQLPFMFYTFYSYISPTLK